MGLKAFLKVLPDNIGNELRRKHFHSVRKALQEARFLQLVHEGEEVETGKRRRRRMEGLEKREREKDGGRG